MKNNIKNCAFQYYSDDKMIVDKTALTIQEAKKLFNENYEDMINKANNEDIEVAIWINMKHDFDYRETLIHLSSPEVKTGYLYEPKYYSKFKI